MSEPTLIRKKNEKGIREGAVCSRDALGWERERDKSEQDAAPAQGAPIWEEELPSISRAKEETCALGVRDEEGSMTIWFAGVIAFLVGLSLFLVFVGAIWSARAHAQAVADMAALAGADLSSVAVFEPQGGSPLACQQATRVAEENGVLVQECRYEQADTLVTVTRPLAFGPWSVHITARARAGPAG